MSKDFIVLERLSQAWKTSVQQKRSTTRFSVKKDVALAEGLEKGQPIFAYLCVDLATNRKLVAFYLDGKEFNGRSLDIDVWRGEGGGNYAKRKLATETQGEDTEKPDS